MLDFSARVLVVFFLITLQVASFGRTVISNGYCNFTTFNQALQILFSWSCVTRSFHDQNTFLSEKRVFRDPSFCIST